MYTIFLIQAKGVFFFYFQQKYFNGREFRVLQKKQNKIGIIL
jgi:hypothetical protein